MFGITTSHDFLSKLEADFADFEQQPESARLALNCAITAYHLHEWVWGDWLKTDYKTRKAIGIRDREGFLQWIDRACPWFSTVQALTNGTKHFQRRDDFKALKVGLLPFAFDLPDAGFDEGHWDGPAPFLTGARAFLLFDFGVEAGSHRWYTAMQILEVVVRFWREFFILYAPKRSAEGTSL
ncbi:hypothetical protein LJR009_005500 [Bosea sp. LjRoot9]|uniref:hypothetical protein n=1 Tax=Bosea sp. LjRoot9 TaxID=3342341 RepID=UPI003ECEADA6